MTRAEVYDLLSVLSRDTDPAVLIETLANCYADRAGVTASEGGCVLWTWYANKLRALANDSCKPGA